MRRITQALALIQICFATTVWAQSAPTADTIQFASAADVDALLAKLEKDRKPDQSLISGPVVRTGPYHENLELNVGPGPSAIHEQEVEFLYVVKGSATLVTGGTLVNETRRNATNLSGTAIQGGSERTFAKGDFAAIPAGMAHGFKAINGEIAVISLHLPSR